MRGLSVLFVVVFLGLCGSTTGFIDQLIRLLSGGRGLRFGGSTRFGGIDRYGPIDPYRRGPGIGYPPVDPHHHPRHRTCQDKGASKCPVGSECVTVSSRRNGEDHLCSRDYSGHCECAPGCLYKQHFIPLGLHRKPVSVGECEWCRCIQHGNHAHTECSKDCHYNGRDYHHLH